MLAEIGSLRGEEVYNEFFKLLYWWERPYSNTIQPTICQAIYELFDLQYCFLSSDSEIWA